MKHVLVAYGSKRGGTAGIATAIAETLRARGLDVECKRAAEVRDVAAFDAVIVGGALYMMRWVREARRFVRRNAAALRTRPVWMFSSGPLDDSAQRQSTVRGVAAMMALTGARGHATFGGRLAADATGFPAAAMAKKHAGDWRDWDRIRVWAADIATELATVQRPRAAIVHPMPSRLVAAVCLIVGLTAIGGGVALLARPDGSLLHASTTLLAHSPFTTFAIPGLVLALVVGVGNMAAAVLSRRGSQWATEAAFAAGAILFGWIAVEMAMLRTVAILQLAFLLAAVVVMAGALRRRCTA